MIRKHKKKPAPKPFPKLSIPVMPYDIYDKILNRLDIEDLFRCYKISQTFENIITDILSRRCTSFLIDENLLAHSPTDPLELMRFVGPFVNELTINVPPMQIDTRDNEMVGPKLIGEMIGPLWDLCTDNLERLHIQTVCPRMFTVIDPYFCIDKLYAFERTRICMFLERHPQLIEFSYTSRRPELVDISQLCIHLHSVKRLRIHCMRADNYEALVACTALEHLDITVRHKTFGKYLHAVDPANHISELHLDFKQFTFTEERAQHFAVFRHLKKLTLNVTCQTLYSSIILPHISNLPHLHTFIVNGKVNDYHVNNVLRYLRNIRYLGVPLRGTRLADLGALTNLRHFHLTICNGPHDQPSDVEREVNRFICTMAQLKSLSYMTLSNLHCKTALRSDAQRALATFNVGMLTVIGPIVKVYRHVNSYDD